MSIRVKPANEWIIQAVIRFILAALSVLLLKSEIQQRKKQTTKFTTKWFKIFSMACIMSGVIRCCASFLVFVPGLCIFMTLISTSCTYFQLTQMGFYQLNRLYYCFSKAQVHSKHGYTKCVIMSMYIIGVLINIILLLSTVFNHPIFLKKCIINDKLQLIYYEIDTVIFDNDVIRYIALFTMALLYPLWDLTTLILYILKIRTIRKRNIHQPDEQEIIQQRIMMILYKIMTLTIFYMVIAITMVFIMGAVVLIFGSDSIISVISISFALNFISFIISYTMYLMMDHNEKKYILFLDLIKMVRAHWLCCKWRNIITDQFNDEIEIDGDDKNNVNVDKPIEFETTDASISIYKLQETRQELSVETLTNAKM